MKLYKYLLIAIGALFVYLAYMGVFDSAQLLADWDYSSNEASAFLGRRIGLVFLALGILSFYFSKATSLKTCQSALTFYLLIFCAFIINGTFEVVTDSIVFSQMAPALIIEGLFAVLIFWNKKSLRVLEAKA